MTEADVFGYKAGEQSPNRSPEKSLKIGGDQSITWNNIGHTAAQYVHIYRAITI